MTEKERAIWKRIHSLYENHLDMPLTAEGLSVLTDDLCKASQEFDNYPLIQGLVMAILDYQDSRFHQLQGETES